MKEAEMIKSLPLNKLLQEIDFVPQAIVAANVFDLAKRYGGEIEKGSDDFDSYEGSGAQIDGTPFAIMHYRGHPQRTSTIYLPFDIQDVKKITEIIFHIASELRFVDKIQWQRLDDSKNMSG
jgi:hypothetical protein